MKKTPIFLIMLFVIILTGSFVYAGQYVNGHYRSDGTYVQGYYRSAPDSTPFNNYSTKGNVNPYTGQKGYEDPYSLQQQQSRQKQIYRNQQKTLYYNSYSQ